MGGLRNETNLVTLFVMKIVLSLFTGAGMRQVAWDEFVAAGGLGTFNAGFVDLPMGPETTVPHPEIHPVKYPENNRRSVR